MKKQVSLITIFVLLNMGIGRLFQESLSVVCFSELSIIAISGFFFWNASAGTIRSWAGKWNMANGQRNVLIQGGLGLSAVAVNIVISQALVIILMLVIFNCTSPSFNLLNASLTNNIAVNLLCYFSLLIYFLHASKEGSESYIQNSNDNTIPDKIKVSKKGSKFLLSPNEVVYVEAANNCIVIHTEKEKFVKYQSLKSLQSKLSNLTFKRTHRSYLVNTDCIKCIKKNKSGDGTITLNNGDSVKLSRTYQNGILD